MSTGEERISIRKKRAIFGRKTVRIQVGRREDFTIHEDVLCNESEFFRAKLQPKRKRIEQDSECAICTEQLEPGFKELTYCSLSCGNNFHYSCIEHWKEEKRAARQAVKLHRFPEIDQDAFRMFNEWLYHGRIAIEDRSEDGHPNLHAMVKAYVLGLYIKDSTFCGAVLDGLLEVAKDDCYYPGPSSINLVYEKTASGSMLRRLMVQLFINGAGDWDEWFDGVDAKEFPPDFLKDIVSAFIKKHPCSTEDLDLQAMKAEFDEDEVFEEDKAEQTDEAEDDSGMDD